MSRLTEFFLSCAGADRALLEHAPSERNKYAGIGATIFFTGLFAALAGGYALYTVFDSYLLAAVFGILWGLMIFNLDRYIVSSMRKRGRFMQELGMALPRIVLAVLISLVIAKPLELKIFEKEIESELAVMQEEDMSRKEGIVRQRYAEENARLNTEITELQEAIAAKAALRDTLRRIAQAEADGTGGTGKRNAGPIYRIKKVDADRAEEELIALRTTNEALIAEKRTQIAANEQQTAASIAALEDASLNGLASRLEAMARLTAKSEAIFIAQWFILLLFIAIETAPIFVKLITQRGPYDYLQGSHEYKFQARHFQSMAETNAQIKEESRGLRGEEADYLEKKLSLNRS